MNAEDTIPDINWDKRKVRRFQRTYQRAMWDNMSNKGPNSFRFEGNEFPLTFAGYFLTHLLQVHGLDKK